MAGTFRWVALVTLGILLLPAGIVVAAAVNEGNYLTFPPQGLSLRWVGKFLAEPYFRDAYLFSLGLAVSTALISTIIGVLASFPLTRIEFRGRALSRSLLIMPLMLPGVVLGLALYTFYVTFQLPVARSFWGILIGHVVLTTPFVIGTVSAVLYNFDVSLEEATRSLGATPWRVFREITLPSIRPGVVAGFVFAMIVSFGAFDISLYLSTPDLAPLPVAMYNSLRYQFEPTAAVAGAFAIFLVVAFTVASARLTDLRRIAGMKLN